MISLIVAYANNRVIGKDGKIPWNLIDDLHHFKELTLGTTLIMGRKTYEEINHPLEGREIIVVSKTKEFNDEHVCTAHSLQEALDLAQTECIMIAGGQALYQEALPLVEKMYITKLDVTVEGDAFFPEFDDTKFEVIPGPIVEEKIKYQYFTYIRLS